MEKASDAGRKELDDSLVSIIMPVYNKEQFLDDAISSVLAQSFTYWELILTDDASTDRSAEIIEGYALRDSRIRHLRLEQNMGAACARNMALEAARGRYVAFLDADDLWRPQKLARQLDLMNAKNAQFCFTAIEMIGEDGVTVKTKRNVKSEIDYSFLLSNTMIACSSVLIDRKLTGDFRMPQLRKGQDYATWLMLLRGGGKAYGINEALTRYRIVSGSVSSNKIAALRRTWRVYRTQEQLGIFHSLYHFCYYTVHAVLKYFF